MKPSMNTRNIIVGDSVNSESIPLDFYLFFLRKSSAIYRAKRQVLIPLFLSSSVTLRRHHIHCSAIGLAKRFLVTGYLQHLSCYKLTGIIFLVLRKFNGRRMKTKTDDHVCHIICALSSRQHYWPYTRNFCRTQEQSAETGRAAGPAIGDPPEEEPPVGWLELG